MLPNSFLNSLVPALVKEYIALYNRLAISGLYPLAHAAEIT
jgi:hypothetical protein